MLFLDRPVLKKKLVDGPEVLGVIAGLHPLQEMLQGLYDCEYAAFFASLLPLGDALAGDRFLFRHSRFLVREYRIKAFGQFLDAYKSVMVGTMADAFGVSTEFLDAELSRFIAGGRLNAKIDKVRGVARAKPGQASSQGESGDLVLAKG